MAVRPIASGTFPARWLPRSIFIQPFSRVAADSATQTLTTWLSSRPQWALSWCQEM
jgi:hypothetical protein